MLSSLIALIVSLDTKIIIVCTSLIAPILFTVLHISAESMISKRRKVDSERRLKELFEAKIESLIMEASKLNFRGLDFSEESEDIIDSIRIDVFARYRAVKRFWRSNKQALKISELEMSNLENKINVLLYSCESKKSYRDHYSRTTKDSPSLLDICSDMIEAVHDR